MQGNYISCTVIPIRILFPWTCFHYSLWCGINQVSYFSSLISLLSSMLASHHNFCHRLQTQVRYFNFIWRIHWCAFQNEIIYGICRHKELHMFAFLENVFVTLCVCLLGICVCTCMCMKLCIRLKMSLHACPLSTCPCTFMWDNKMRGRKKKREKKKSVLNLWSKGTYTYVHVFHENVLS